MTTIVSFAVCQCHGTRQPDASLRSTDAGPKRGLPRRIAAVAHAGMFGIAMYCTDFGWSEIMRSSAFEGSSMGMSFA
jgi:hypothetical protein